MAFNVGIVGFGGAGFAHHKHFTLHKETKVSAVFDTKEDGLARARKLSGNILVTNNIEKFLASNIDIVSICSPDNTHAEYFIKSLAAKKHILCEKPLTDSLEGCKIILQAKQAIPNVVSAVQHQMRFLPVHCKMKQLLKQKALGDVFYIEGYYVHNLTKRAWVYDDWRRTDNATPLVYSGCHFVDLLRWLLDDEVEEIFGFANSISFPEYPESDCNVLLLRFRSGIIGKVIVAFGAGRPQDHSVRIYGSQRSIENNLLFEKNGKFKVFHRPFITVPPGERFHLKTNLIRLRDELLPLCMSYIFEAGMKLFPQRGSYSISSFPIRLYEHDYAVRMSIIDFLNAIRHKKEPGCTVKESAKTVVTCLAGVESYRSRKPKLIKDFWLNELD